MAKTYSSRMWNLLVNTIGGSSLVKYNLRQRIYNQLGRMGIETNDIRPGCFFFGSNIRIGTGTMVNHRCYFENRERIEIGRNCRVAMEVMFCTSTHKMGGPSLRGGEYDGRPIVIGDGCWIGARALILPGVTIGNGCVIAAGSVVAKDCKPNSLYAGVPAKWVKDLPVDGQP